MKEEAERVELYVYNARLCVLATITNEGAPFARKKVATKDKIINNK